MMGVPQVVRPDDAAAAANDDGDDDGGRSAKRPRLESLVPADQWAVSVPSVRVRFAIADDSTKRQWQLNGQTIELEFDSTTLVSQLKSKLSPLLGDFPPNKQKMQTERLGVLKDDFSLAKYNFNAEETISVSVKGRGGKK